MAMIGLDCAWVERDRDSFDFFLAELATFGYKSLDGETAWNAPTRHEFHRIVEASMSSRR
jgi:hypothetical protein